VLFHQNTTGDALYIVMSGALEIVLEEGESNRHVAAIAAGGFIGERSLMTGEPRSATAVARADTVTLVIEKAAMLEVLRRDRELAARIAELMAKRDVERAELAHDAAAHAAAAKSMVARIRAFFAL
jgi:CRP-like cAMP-binding protein